MPLYHPQITDRSPAGLDAAYRDWRFEMLRAHDGHVDVSRARFDALTAEPTVAEIEADQARAAAAMISIHSDCKDHQKIWRAYLAEGDDHKARLIRNYIAERAALWRRHRVRYLRCVDRVSAIEERREFEKSPRLLAAERRAEFSEDRRWRLMHGERLALPVIGTAPMPVAAE